MNVGRSIQFFDDQFRQQLDAGEHALNPFEGAALPHLQGKVLDYGCGLGNLAVEAARRGCSVLALDASPVAIDHVQLVAAREKLPLHAELADLSSYMIQEEFDAIVCIGLLMFFDCPTALRQLAQIQVHVRPGGLAVVNVLIAGTTYMDMFAAEGYCLFEREQLRQAFAGWDLLSYTIQEFPAPRDTRKVFATAIACKS